MLLTFIVIEHNARVLIVGMWRWYYLDNKTLLSSRHWDVKGMKSREVLHTKRTRSGLYSHASGFDPGFQWCHTCSVPTRYYLIRSKLAFRNGPLKNIDKHWFALWLKFTHIHLLERNPVDQLSKRSQLCLRALGWLARDQDHKQEQIFLHNLWVPHQPALHRRTSFPKNLCWKFFIQKLTLNYTFLSRDEQRLRKVTCLPQTQRWIS